MANAWFQMFSDCPSLLRRDNLRILFRCGLPGQLPFARQVQAEVSECGGLSSGQTWPLSTLVSHHGSPKSWPWPTCAPAVRILTWFCWLSLVQFAASKPGEHIRGRQLM